MKKQIFSRKLFLDSLKQLRIIGIMSTVILTAFAAIRPIGMYISGYKTVIIENGVERVIYSTRTVTALEIQPLLVLIYVLVAPLMALYIFNFLNRRNACDFYHSIPKTRSCVFLSLFSACVAWIVIILLSSTAMSLITTGILHKYFIVNYKTIFASLFTVFSASILVLSATVAAMTITGTVFNNVFVTAMLLFVPRIFLTTIYTLVNGSIPFLLENAAEGILLSPDINIAFGTLTSVFFFTSGFEEMLYSMASGAYSLVLGLIFAAGALLGFCRRKSEVAGNAAASKRLSAVYRITLASTISLAPCASIFRMIRFGGISGNNAFELFVLYFVVVIAYALYELITSKKLKSMLRSLPGLLYVAGANVLILLVLFGYRGSLLNFTPAPSEVKSVNITGLGDSNNYERDYISDCAAEINITDEKTIKLVSEKLAAMAKQYKKNPQEFSNSFYDNGSTLVVRFNTRGRSATRLIPLNDADYNYITSTLEKNEQYKDLLYKLPEKNVGISFSSYNLSMLNLSEKELNKMYALYCQDMQKIPPAQQLENLSNNVYTEYYLRLNFTRGFYGYSLMLPITDDHPHVLEYLNQKVYDATAGNRAELIKQLKSLEQTKIWDYLNVGAKNAKDGDGNVVVEQYYISLNNLPQDKIPAAVRALAALLEASPDRAAKAGDAYIDVTLFVPYDTEENQMREDYAKEGKNYFGRFVLANKTLPDELVECFSFTGND